MPDAVVVALRAVSAAFRGWGAKAQITMPLRDGDELKLRDRTFTVHHRPGHSPTDTIFHDAARRELLGGDHLIARISSNPLITAPLDGSGERPKALLTYLRSLRATQAMDDIDVVHAGHGEAGDRPRRAHRPALPHARQARGEDPQAARRRSR